MKKYLLLTLFGLSFVMATPAKANNPFDFNGNGIPDVVDPSSPMYWALNSTAGGAAGAAASGATLGGALAISAGVAAIFYVFIASEYCSHPKSFSQNKGILKDLFFHFPKALASNAWCGSQEMYSDLSSWISKKIGKDVNPQQIERDFASVNGGMVRHTPKDESLKKDPFAAAAK